MYNGLLAKKLTKEDIEGLLKECYEKIAMNPISLPYFKEVTLEDLKTFFHTYENYGYYAIGFIDPKSLEIVGVCLFNKGSPWYNPRLKVLSEECTIALKRGYGITRAICEYMLQCKASKEVDLVMASSANKCVENLIENTYAKYGFSTYKTYYK